MNDLNVIDRFLQAFITYIDAGLGLLGGDVDFLTSTLIGSDITRAGLFWAMGGKQDVIGRFLKNILYIGAFALIINSFSPSPPGRDWPAERDERRASLPNPRGDTPSTASDARMRGRIGGRQTSSIPCTI